MPIGAYLAFSITAARIAASADPPFERTDTTANWADPAKVVADMTSGAVHPMPDVLASTPNESAKSPAASPIGAIIRAPSAYRPLTPVPAT